MSAFNYCEAVDQVLGTTYSKHRTLRSCLDPGSAEWEDATMEDRIEVLKRLVASGNSLQSIFLNYKLTYIEMNKTHVSNNLENGLAAVLQYLLEQQIIEDPKPAVPNP